MLRQQIDDFIVEELTNRVETTNGNYKELGHAPSRPRALAHTESEPEQVRVGRHQG